MLSSLGVTNIDVRRGPGYAASARHRRHGRSRVHSGGCQVSNVWRASTGLGRDPDQSGERGAIPVPARRGTRRVPGRASTKRQEYIYSGDPGWIRVSFVDVA